MRKNSTVDKTNLSDPMAELMLQLAGRSVRVSTLHDDTAQYCKNYIIDSDEDAEISVTMTQADIEQEQVKAWRTDEVEGRTPREHSDGCLEITAVQRKIADALFQYDTIVFHGSVVAVDGQAFLFTAKSGTGKSTHTRMWRELFGERAVMVNDDKPFLQITDHGVIAYGSPWNGKHHLGSNVAVPLKAICILERGEVNRIHQILPQQALPMLIQQSSRPMNGALMGKYMELIDALSQKVNFYRMKCNISLDAAALAYETMRK